MQDHHFEKDPFNKLYLFVILGVLLALPLMHPLIGVFVFLF